MPETKDATMTIRLPRTDRDQLAAIAKREAVPISQVTRRAIRAFLAGAAVIAAVLTLTACGPQEVPGAAVSAAADPVATQVQEPAAEPAAVESETPAPIPTTVVYLGETQVVHVDGQAVARVEVQSYDPADDGVAIEVNSFNAPFVVDPAAFTLTNADGTEISGVAAVAAWDVTLTANDQTMGQVRFAGATSPVVITYAPEGAEPLVWAFN